MWTAEKIKALRTKYGETQAQFAERIGVSVQAVRWWEQDRGRPIGPAEKLLDRLEEDLEKAVPA
jgi:DNA-binding transcriptional regulator YiaG